ncbi:hypothetical protein NLO93_26595, partial [Pseudomonas savastanoi]|uniref:hypothetical protein n=1 Tax=Pseudomonas savastanoi TaxID=29438 RepID=UPI00210BC8A9
TCRPDTGEVRPKSGKGTEKSLSIHFSAWVIGEKSFLPTSTPRRHHSEGAFLGGLPCIGIIEIPIHQEVQVTTQVTQAIRNQWA